MSTGAQPAPGELGDDEVLEYLRTRPDFLARHPQVLEWLEVPHACGGAVSLVEYQVSVLREQTRTLRQKVRELVQTARANESLGSRMHALTLSLLECARLDDVLERLRGALEQDFDADLAAVRLFAPPARPADAGLGEFVHDDLAARELFAGVLAAERPVCGRLKLVQAQYLFADRGAEVGSGALLPLGREERFGLLAICSRDPERFRPGMGTVFVRQLAEVVTRVVAPYVATGS